MTTGHSLLSFVPWDLGKWKGTASGQRQRPVIVRLARLLPAGAEDLAGVRILEIVIGTQKSLVFKRGPL